ncbi:phage tail tape measure protein [Ectopseudomonas toyotomiensis]|uniref:Phage tail tape measure protein, TP901 family, core region n=1 Tax=Ectopseudomonas toyotomiensis TaxID=554344 RepID=A0A1I5WZ94_9GAMM|nr:phage tail tape measure protein [Pseudomonas toyotomiensis]PIA66364.1 phage tail tape measure protein [Pseudomonas toyotomiensis]SFQ24984.1 phage tail tape measure protein, TP901 family, core region [Pseudomonas toyotomiensis]SFQ45820.1 phage tail tape measure protein, TP901 family, core region [Pseudomonas toyotomiensis]
MTDVRLSVSVDADQGRRTLQTFQAGYKALVDQLRQPLGQIGAFRDLQASLVQNEAQLNATRQRVRELRDELIRTEKPTRDQQNAYRAATTEARNLEQAIAGQKGQLAQLSAALKNAGVDTNQLSNEQKRLAADMAQASRAADQQARIAGARDALGVRPHREIRGEIVQLQRQYQLLARTGQLTSAELAQAKVRLRERVAELEQGTNGWAQSLTQARLQVGAAAASMGAMVYAGGAVLKFYAQFAQRMGEVNSITDLNQAQFQALSTDVRQLSQAMGKEAAQSAAALYDILSSGVSPDNSIQTLELATRAAVAGVTDTATAVRGGLAVVNAYGEGIDNLGLRYDQLFLAVRDGVTTFPELASYIGDTLPTAKAAGVEFSEVAAAIALMTKAGIRTPQATTALKGAINALAAPGEAAAKSMAGLGIEWRGLTATLEDIASRNLGLAALREILPDVEARTAVLALTQNMAGLKAEVEAMGNASGALDAAYEKMAATPQAELDRFNASWGELKLQLGEAATAFLPLVQGATEALNAFNALPSPIRNITAGLIFLVSSLLSMRAVILALRNPFGLFLGHMAATPAAAGAAATGMSTVGTAATSLIPKLRTLADVAKLAKGGLALGVVSWTGGNLAELYDLYKQNQELTQSQRDYEQALQDTITRTVEYADTVVMPAASVARMTETERQAYAERLRLAEEHYRKQSELLSRQHTDISTVSPDALASARTARQYREALQGLQNAHAQREAAERRHTDTLAKIKADNLKSIQDALGKEILAYDEAAKALDASNKKTQAAMKARAELAKEFDQLVKDMRAPTDTGPATFGDVTAAQAAGRQALQRGDTEEAIRQARAGAEVLRELQQAGANTYGFAGIAQQLAKLADEAARLDEVTADVERIDAQGRVDEIKVRMDDLLAQAEAFKRINIEFTGFEQSAEYLEQQAKALAERLKQYMVIPVNYVGTDGKALSEADKKAAEVLGTEPVKRAAGGWVDGPGSPTSDSVLLAASRREFVVNAWAAQRLGAANLEYLNSTGDLPQRAVNLPDFPDFPQSLDRVGERQPINLAMPWGGSYALEGAPSEVRRLSDDLHYARRKLGGTP